MKKSKIQMNPIYKNEMKLLTRTMRFPLLVFFYNAILAFVSLLAYYMSLSSSMGRVGYDGILTVYGAIMAIEFIMIAFFVPSFSAGSIAGERERQTLELLLTTKTKPIHIVLGKLASSISGVLILFLTSLPVIAIVFSIGGVYVMDLMKMLFLAIVTAVYLGSFSLYFSSKVKKTIAASVISYAVVIFISLGTYIILMITLLIQYQMLSPNMTGQTFVEPNLGGLVLILLINPTYTILSAMGNLYGGASVMKELVFEIGKCNEFIINHWFYISILVQMAISALLICLAARNLDPMRRKGRKRKE